MVVYNEPLNMPKQSVRAIIALYSIFLLETLFAVVIGYLIIVKETDIDIMILITSMVGIVNLIIGYYFGLRNNSGTIEYIPTLEQQIQTAIQETVKDDCIENGG